MRFIRPAMLFLSTLLAAGLAPAGSATKPAEPNPQLPGAPGLQKLAPGEYHLFFLVNGKILTIGSNRADELGTGETGAASQAVPVPVALPSDLRFIDVAAGGYHSLAADTLGHVWTWGSNYYGQRGDGTPVGDPGTSKPRDSATPQMIRTDATGKPFDGVVSVGAMLWFDMAIKKDGTLWVWGKNAPAGILGNGDAKTVVVNRPTQVPFDPDVSIVQVSASRDMILARDSKGGVWSWAGGDAPKANRGSSADDYTKPQRLPGLPAIKQIAAGDQFSLALDVDGALWGWGLCGTYLGLGPATGGDIRLLTPTKLSFPEFAGHKVTFVAASSLTVHVILDDGSLWGWGDSAMGGVGNGTMLDWSKHNYAWDYKRYGLLVFRPVRIAPQVNNFKAIYTNALCFYTYAVTTDNKLYSWGRNKTGIMGNGILPTGQTAEHPDSWDIATATQVSPLTLKTATKVPSKP